MAFGRIKRLLHESATNSLPEQFAAEAAAIREAARSEDGGEGVAAFLGRRAPAFTGN